MFDKQQANSIFWSPQGQFMVLAGLRRSVVFLLEIRNNQPMKNFTNFSDILCES